MKRVGAVERQTLLALVLAIPIALLVVVTFSPFRTTSADEVEPEPVAPKPKPKQVTPKGKGGPNAKADPSSAAVPPPREVGEVAKREQQLEQAQVGCKRISDAVTAYVMSPANPGASDEDRWPIEPGHLVNPPFGGTSFLPNGQKDLVDPWGKSYQFRTAQKKDSGDILLVFTTAPNGTPISQFGVGAKAQPQE
ncbi:hypothetical protein R5W23_004792 [Gemmata sp. JC673]|uniref:Type II secretion system protein GspG C-terminal domain-containing protein n=1 Tax=Gemmata algarum TaxID=2975278 RepID=A0ABU5F919_9BACT|nr:hypothetical protein [Gemmata algarum]MDY3563292.1 hypothetical protein [Gemmata algarum]